MLVLTRKIGQRISIGDNITVVVTKTAGNRVTLGIEAPKDVRIVRGELERIFNEFDEAPESEEAPAATARPTSSPMPLSLSFPVADACTFVPPQAR
jgi:carbon storage regulator CsrA